MSTTQIVVLIVVVLVLLAVVGYILMQQKKRKQLRSQFGPEYDRTVESSGKRKEAERELAERAERRRQLDIRPLPEQDRLAFADRWRSTQEDFVDRPSMAVRQADLLVAEVMGRRGYPVGDFDQQARDVSVDHAHVVEEYRAAHHISQLNDRDQATTEQLRQAMVHYRALFTELLRDERGGDDSYRTGGAHDRRDDRDRHDVRSDDRSDDRSLEQARTADPGYATDEDRRTSERADSRFDDRSAGGTQSQPDRIVVEGGLVRPETDRPGDSPRPQR